MEKENDLRSSIFTRSGNFCSDIFPRETTISSDAVSNNKNATDESFVDTLDNAKTSLETEFIDTFRRKSSTLPTSIVTLRALLLHFPKLVFVVRNTDNEFELHFWRDSLLQALRMEEAKFPKLVFTSLERGLKHAGMEVTQSTHGGEKLKKWGIKKDAKEGSELAPTIHKRKSEQGVFECPKKKLK